MRVLVLNPGSSTLKWRLIDTVAGRLDGGTAEHVADGGVAEAARQAVERCPRPLDAVACRVVHGGGIFTEPTRVEAGVRAEVRELGRLAPLHNPVAADILDALQTLLPGVPCWAVFDTAFHATLPEEAWRYALPRELALRRYGFHGISHQHVSRRLEELAGGTRHVVLHLGNGCSACAVRDGKSIDTSMGLTPNEGLPMGTRSGDIGPDAVLALARERGIDQAERTLTRESGFKGLAGTSEVRELLARGDPEARFALDHFAYRLRKTVGAYAATLEGLDALAFTGGIGEHAAPVRESVCTALGWLGVRLDREANARAKGEARITSADSPVPVWVIPADEEAEIARQVAAAPDASR
ncbi:MAG: acetate/propionate family kinase [Gemmataceae bacterium]|nr:acetate/propionate family kinase [Gemmataceae bacterium]